MRREHWSASAERVWEDRLLLGESPSGDLWLPKRGTRRVEERPWTRRLNLRRPTHWPRYIGSRLRRRIVWLEDL